MRRSLTLLFMFLVSAGVCHATHNRAGEITFKWIEGYTYEVTVTTFTYVLSIADRPQLEVQWGDNTSSIVNRVQMVRLPNLYKKNVYIMRHTYPGPGTYHILMQDPNRNFGVRNIPNSVNTIFSIQSTLMINPILGGNSTPVLLNPPIDKGAVGHLFIHNPAAYDADGDSLSYRFTPCTEENGNPIKGYTLPKASDTIYINSVTGDLIWNAPMDTGYYNIAFLIEKWRKGVKLASVERDMQIDVYRTNNIPPVISPVPDYCVHAGTTIDQDIVVTDANNDSILVTWAGGPFIINPNAATMQLVESHRGYAKYHFQWHTGCVDVRDRAYQVLIRAKDTLNDIGLTDIKTFNIRVIADPPANLQARPGSNNVLLSWSPGQCANITGYEVYRKISPSGFAPDSCQTGLPADAGFTKIGQTKSRLDTVYIDNNNGTGLSQGNPYCYRVVAVYPNSAKSVVSEEVCTTLVPGLPALMQVSVDKTGAADGIIRVSWAKPRYLDTIPANGPYEYVIFRSQDLFGKSLVPIDSFGTTDLNDTVYLDKNLNTTVYPYSYRVDLYNNAPGDRRLLGKQQEIASSLYMKLTGKDNIVDFEFVKSVPWINTRYIIYRYNESKASYDSIGYTDNEKYTDTGLKNGVNYCYQVKSIGFREAEGLMLPNWNYSHIICATPIDSIAPCPPDLSVTSRCDSMYNALVWTNPNNSCANDVVRYNIYYSPTLDGTMDLIATKNSATDTTFNHYPVASIAGCYTVTAIDSFNNESKPSIRACVDECSFYSLPNVFTPNGDEINDVFTAINRNNFVKSVNMRIYNRWGQLVFKTTDPLINWDGRDYRSKSIVSPGVYYYICDVYEPRLDGLQPRSIVGFIHVFTDK